MRLCVGKKRKVPIRGKALLSLGTHVQASVDRCVNKRQECESVTAGVCVCIRSLARPCSQCITESAGSMLHILSPSLSLPPSRSLSLSL